MIEQRIIDDIKRISEKLEKYTENINPSGICWIETNDEEHYSDYEYYCESCADTEIERLRADDPATDYCVREDSCGCCEYDGAVFCATCGQALNYSLCCPEEELQVFESALERMLKEPAADDAYCLLKIIECVGYNGDDDANAQILLRLHKIALAWEKAISELTTPDANEDGGSKDADE